MQVEQCTNCEGIIGKLETAFLHNGNVVCGVCDIKLKSIPTGAEITAIKKKHIKKNNTKKIKILEGNSPASVKQLRLAADLGISVSSNITQFKISELIDDAMQDESVQEKYENRPPTYKQKKFAKRLGISNPESMNRDQLSVAIDQRLALGDPPKRNMLVKLYDYFDNRIHAEPKLIKNINTIHVPVERKKAVVIDNRPICQFCGGVMVRSKTGRHFLVSLIVNLSMIFWGFVLTFLGWFTIILPIIGITMILIALFRQSNRKKVLKCTQCKVIVDRA